MAHLLDVVEERLHGAEELTEVGALAEALLVAIDRVPLDTDDVRLGILDATCDLRRKSVRRGIQGGCGLAVRTLELVAPIRGNAVANVFDDHHPSSGTDRCRPPGL